MQRSCDLPGNMGPQAPGQFRCGNALIHLNAASWHIILLRSVTSGQQGGQTGAMSAFDHPARPQASKMSQKSRMMQSQDSVLFPVTLVIQADLSVMPLPRLEKGPAPEVVVYPRLPLQSMR